MVDKICTFSLSIEEYSLCLAMLNRPDLAQGVIKAYYDNLTKEQVDSRMTAASHSLLARGICGLTPEGSPKLDNELEQTILPIAVYDRIYQFNLVSGSSVLSSNIHVRDGKTFTSHNVQVGVVHLLEHGPLKALVPFLLDLLADYGKNNPIFMPAGTSITLGVLGKAINASKNRDELRALLDSLTWPDDLKKIFTDDLVNAKGRGTLIRYDVKSSMDENEIGKATKPSLLFLNGKSNTWLFSFSSPNDDAVGIPVIVTKKEFEDQIKNFVK